MLQLLFGEHLDRLDPTGSGFLVIAVAATICYYASTRRSATESDGKVKGTKVPYLPSRLPVLGNALELMRNAERMHDWIAEKLVPQDGKPILLRLPGKDDMLFTAKPEHFEQILKTQFDNFPKSDHIHDVFFDLMGDGVVITNGDTWRRQRRVLVSLFSTRALREHMTPVSHKYAVVLRGVLEDAANSQKPLDVFTLVHRYTLDVFAEIGFGTEMDLLRSGGIPQPFEEAIEDAQYISAERFKQPLTLWKLKRWLNVGSERRMREAMRVIDEHVMDIVSTSIERRNLQSLEEEAGAPRKAAGRDVVSIILDSMDASNQPVQPEEVRNIAVAALIAGRDTTADGLAWLFHVLSKNPRVESKLRAELAANVPKLSTDERYVPSMDELQSVVYLEAVIRELLRLLPPGPLIATHCIRDTVFPDGTFVAKGTDIGLAFYSTARLTSVWGPNAASFVPERFLDKDTGKLLSAPPTKFCAFSAGPRICVGQNLAFVEMKIVLASVVSRYHLVPDAQQQQVAYTQGITLGMKHPLFMRVERVDSPTFDKSAS